MSETCQYEYGFKFPNSTYMQFVVKGRTYSLFGASPAIWYYVETASERYTTHSKKAALS